LNLKTAYKVLACFSIAFACPILICSNLRAEQYGMKEELARTKHTEYIVDLLGVQKYEQAYHESSELLESSTAYPAPELVELSRSCLCRKYLMRAYAYLAENDGLSARERFIHAGNIDSDYTKCIAELYESKLSSYTASCAANRVFTTLQADEKKDILYSRQIRHRMWQREVLINSKLHKQELEHYFRAAQQAMDKDNLKRANVYLEKYLSINPLDEEAQALSVQVKQTLATRELENAWPLLAKGKSDAASKYVGRANRIAQGFVKEEANKYLKQAMESIANGKTEDAKEPTARASLLAPEDKDIERLDDFLAGRVDIFPYALDLFHNEKYKDAARWMSLYAHAKPDNARGQYYKEITSAYKNIQNGNYWTARQNLVEALKIDPSREDSIVLFERLEEVLEILGE